MKCVKKKEESEKSLTKIIKMHTETLSQQRHGNFHKNKHSMNNIFHEKAEVLREKYSNLIHNLELYKEKVHNMMDE